MGPAPPMAPRNGSAKHPVSPAAPREQLAAESVKLHCQKKNEHVASGWETQVAGGGSEQLFQWFMLKTQAVSAPGRAGDASVSDKCVEEKREEKKPQRFVLP